MTDLYNEYKPFRNYMRQFITTEGLVDIWQYSLHIIDDQPLPNGYAVGRVSLPGNHIKHEIFPWDLDILSKEIVLNGNKLGTKSLRNWADIKTAIKYIRHMDNVAYGGGSAEQRVDIMLEIYRIANRQFPWQINPSASSMMRIFKIFGESAVESIVLKQLGMSTRQFLLLGAAVTGHFLKKWGMSTIQNYKVLGISQNSSEGFFNRMTCTAEELREATKVQQSYNRDWLYSWNPLEATPLVRFDRQYPDRVICPIPRFLIRRVSSGIFYDLVNASGFDNSYGNAFEAYIGDVLRAACPGVRFQIFAEQPYKIGSRHMHGVDWILSDKTGHLFIECKTKRLTIQSKIRSDTVALDKDLQKMAEAIVQHYRNIIDAQAGHTLWKSDNLPIFPILITLEDWYIFSPKVEEILISHVHRLLAKAGISNTILAEMPFTIASAFEFEAAAQVIASTSIFSLFSKKTAGDRRWWSFLPFIQNEFPNEVRNVNWNLFANEWRNLVPSVIDGMPMAGSN